MVEEMKIMVTSLKRSQACTAILNAPNPAAGHHQPTPEARGGGQKDQSHVQEAVAARVQEGLEELSHTEGQEGRR